MSRELGNSGNLSLVLGQKVTHLLVLLTKQALEQDLFNEI